MAERRSESDASRAYLLWGEDSLSRDEVVRNFRERMLARPAGDFNLSEFRAPDLTAREIIAACDSLPFADTRRLVIVYRLFSWRPRLAAGRQERAESANPLKSEREALLEYLPSLAPTTTLLLVEAALSPTQRAELVARLPAHRSDERTFSAPRDFGLEQWLMKRASARGGELGPGVAGILREHGPRSLEALDQELAKLIAYAGDEAVTVSALNELLPGAELVVFDLLDAVAEGRSADALRTLRRLLNQGLRPEELAPQIISLYRRLLICRLALAERADPSAIQRTHGVKLIEKLKSQARALSLERIESALDRLVTFDRALKRGEVEPEVGLELLITDLTAEASAARSR
jgi:DNA polymerase III subunit delta